MSNNKVMTPLTKRFLSAIKDYVIEYNDETDPYIKSKLKEGLKGTLRIMTDQKVTMVSEAVMNACQPLGIDPFELLWKKRNILGRDESGKSRLSWEHTTPLEEFFKSLIACESEQAVEEVVKNYSGVCWIMRDEDNALNAAGFRSKRPDGWEVAYEACGIKIIRK